MILIDKNGLLHVEARSCKNWLPDANIYDVFTIALSDKVDNFNPYTSYSVDGSNKTGRLTLSYGKLATDPTSCKGKHITNATR